MALSLEIVSYTSSSVTVLLSGLDNTYERDDRFIEWEVNGSPNGQTDIPKEISEYTYTFTGLASEKELIITGWIFWTEAESSGVYQSTELPKVKITLPLSVPVIESFNAYQDTTSSRLVVRYSFRVTSLLFETTETGGVVDLYIYNEAENCVYNKTWRTGSEVKISASAGVYVDNDIGEGPGIYTVKLVAINVGTVSEISVEKEIIVSVKEIEEDTEKPICSLNCYFEDRVYSYDNGRVTGTIFNYPNITASDFNQFCEDINTVRIKAGLAEYTFITAVPDGEMSHEVFRRVCDAINQIYIACGEKAVLYFDETVRIISPELIGNIQSAAQDIRDIVYET